jgi:hypothetical protein
MKADVVSKYCQDGKLEYRKVDPKVSPTALVTVLGCFVSVLTVKPIQYIQFPPFEMYYTVIGLAIDAPPV